MSDRFQNKFRIKSTRAPWWNYSWNGTYFLTICTEKHISYFGLIKGEKLIATKSGKKAEEYWLEIPKHFPFVKLDEYVVMPNHIHGLITLSKPSGKNQTITSEDIEKIIQVMPDEDDDYFQNHQKIEALFENPKPKNPRMSSISPEHGSVGAIVRSYKSAVTKWCNENNLLFGWQARYYDHIIRDKKDYLRIKKYIINNSKNWDDDKFFNDKG